MLAVAGEVRRLPRRSQTPLMQRQRDKAECLCLVASSPPLVLVIFRTRNYRKMGHDVLSVTISPESF